MFKKSFLILTIIGLLVSPYSFDFKKTNIGLADTIGVDLLITSNTTWKKSNSPYIIDQSNVTISTDAMLIIEPGVIVKLNKASIYLDGGTMLANGTASEPIIFTSNNDNAHGGFTSIDSGILPVPGDWGQINAWNKGKLVLNYVQINYGGSVEVFQCRNNIINTNSANAYVNNIPVVSVYDASVEIGNSEISKNTNGINISYLDLATDFTMHDSRIFNNTGLAFSSYDEKSIDVANNWWGDNSGPYHASSNTNGKGGEIYGNVVFDPWIGKDLAKKKNPVIIVPGIMGSYLNKNNASKNEIWPNILKMLLPGNDSYLDQLILPANGEPTSSDIIPTDVIKSLSSTDLFSGLITELKNNGYEEGRDLFVFPYDWRLSVKRSAGVGVSSDTDSLAKKINDIKSQTNSDKVDLIAHSMGGLVVKEYLKNFGTSSVDKFIDIATPHLGAPKALKILTYGDNMDMFPLNSERTRIISQNMPAVYQLLPSEKYFDYENSDYESYIYDGYNIDHNKDFGSLNYLGSKYFMINTGRNETLLNVAENVHSEIDEYYPQDNGVDTYNILACGSPTMGRLFTMGELNNGHGSYQLKYIDGDGTVPRRSAQKMLYPDVFVKGIEHAVVPSGDGVRQFIVAILNNKESEFDYGKFTSLSQSENVCGISGTQVSFHSPITLSVFDENGNHLGLDQNGDLENQIVGSQYDIIDGNKFAFLPKGHTYKVVGQATDKGSFDARVQTIENGEVLKIAYFNQVPLNSTSAKVEINTNDNQAVYNLKMDQNGDGVFERTIQPSAILNSQQAGDLVAPQTTVMIKGEKGNNGWYFPGVRVSLAGSDDNSGVLKTEYSLDNGTTWNVYKKSFNIEKVGNYIVQYHSIDRAGNVESVKTEKIIIKKSKDNERGGKDKNDKKNEKDRRD